MYKALRLASSMPAVCKIEPEKCAFKKEEKIKEDRQVKKEKK